MKIVGDRRLVGLAAGCGAVLLGLLYMTLAGAPQRMLLMNLAALGIGLALFGLVRSLPAAAERLRGPVLLGLAVFLLATTVGGTAVQGATRWIAVAGLSIQPSLIIVALLVTGHASRPDRWSGAALALATAAIALQPDRGVAVVLLFGTAAIALRRPDRTNLALAALAAAGLAATLLQPDALPAIPYVDRILSTAFEAHPLAGLAVWMGIALLFVPALVAPRITGNAAPLAFAAVWAGAVLAASLGNYPTPLVGYGGSAIIGYLLSLLPLATQTSIAGSSRRPLESDSADSGHHLRFA